MPDAWPSMRSIARWVLPVFVGPSTATIRDRPSGDTSFHAMCSPYRHNSGEKQANDEGGPMGDIASALRSSTARIRDARQLGLVAVTRR